MLYPKSAAQRMAYVIGLVSEAIDFIKAHSATRPYIIYGEAR